MSDAQLDKLRSRIRKSRLKRDDIVVLATELQSLSTRDTSRMLFDLLREEPIQLVIENTLDLFADLIAREPEWVRIIRKCIAKRGRCPRPLRPTVARLLADRGGTAATTPRSVEELLADLELIEEDSVHVHTSTPVTTRVSRTSLFGGSQTEVTIQVSKELTDIRRMEDLAAALKSCETDFQLLRLDFSGVDHVYVVGLAALAAWCSRRGIRPEIINDSSTTGIYLDTIGFRRAFDASAMAPFHADAGFAMPILPLNNNSSPDDVAVRLTRIVENHTPMGRDDRQALLILFAELVENIHRHSGSAVHAFACAQVYPLRRKLCICIVDVGIGIRESIMSGTNLALQRRVREGESPVKLACSPLVTSKPDRHSGYGLYVAGEIVVPNGGTFRVFSGTEIYTRYLKDWRRMERVDHPRSGWNGTWLAAGQSHLNCRVL
ncbi:MAG: hypothetical protein K2Y37_26325 [Pirellulales bacterium]|nr:hypothetical protein [Pirellulales bacterium]